MNGSVVSTRSGKPNLEALKNKRGVDPICDSLHSGLPARSFLADTSLDGGKNRLQDAV